jgi:hypothetical protein
MFGDVPQKNHRKLVCISTYILSAYYWPFTHTSIARTIKICVAGLHPTQGDSTASLSPRYAMILKLSGLWSKQARTGNLKLVGLKAVQRGKSEVSESIKHASPEYTGR